jgi:hypothetical protein
MRRATNGGTTKIYMLAESNFSCVHLFVLFASREFNVIATYLAIVESAHIIFPWIRLIGGKVV